MPHNDQYPASDDSGEQFLSPPMASPAPPRAQPTDSTPVAKPAAKPLPPTPQATPVAKSARPVPVQATPAGARARPIPATQKPQGVARPIPVSPGQEEDVDSEEEEADAGKIVLNAAPPWLVSLVVHMVGLIILGLIMLPELFDGDDWVELEYAQKIGKQLESMEFESAESKELSIPDPAKAFDEIPVEDPEAAIPDIDLMMAETGPTPVTDPVTIGTALSGREKGSKEALLAAYGGNKLTEAAVARGLEWLKRNQSRTGLWSLKGPYIDGAQTENRVAATAMALLAFQGAGHTTQVGEYKAVVTKGWNAMLKKQLDSGTFFGDGPDHHRFYSQGQATIAICELYAMTKDSKFRGPAQKAVDYLVKTQDRAGGWRYYVNDPSTPGSDTSVTGWVVMALQSARMAGLNVPSEVFEKISKYLDKATTDGGSQYAYMPEYAAKLSMTAEGLLCRQYLGWKHNDPRLTRGVAILNRNPIDFGEKDFYYWYYATQVVHHMGGKPWDDWNHVMRDELPAEQELEGRERGSWDPTGDLWQLGGGRLYATCLSIYMLEVYYRHLPLYKHKVRLE